MGEDLVTVSGIATMLGVRRETAHRYTRRDDFPEPEVELPIGRVWKRADVEAWAKRTLPLPTGRPPKTT